MGLGGTFATSHDTALEWYDVHFCRSPVVITTSQYFAGLGPAVAFIATLPGFAAIPVLGSHWGHGEGGYDSFALRVAKSVGMPAV